MRLAAVYSFNRGNETVSEKYPELLVQINECIKAVDETQHKDKESKEKTMLKRMLYSPVSLNRAFKKEFEKRDWWSVRVGCEYPTSHYLEDYKIRTANRGAFREMDFVKNKLGVEVQFGKYAFMVYNVCAKMTIFKNLGHINTGVEIVPVKAFAEEMSTGVSYFEQFIWDLESRGVSNIDIPVLILGIDADPELAIKKQLFGLKSAIETIGDLQKRQQLLEMVADLQANVGHQDFAIKVTGLSRSAGPHHLVIAPWISKLLKWE